MNALLLNEASLMVVVAGEFVCVALQVVHLSLAVFQEGQGNGRLALGLEAAVTVHLALALFLTVGAGLIGAPVLAWALETSRAFWLLWINAALAVAAVAVALCVSRPGCLVDALFMCLCTPAAIRALGPAWNLVALADVAWLLFRGLSGIVGDLVRRSEELSGLSIAEALMGMPAGILVVGPTGGSTFMNVRMRSCLVALGLPCDLGDQSGLWGRLAEIGRDFSAEASSLGVPDALGGGEDRLLVDLPDGTTWLFARDQAKGRGPGARVVCVDVTEAARANAELGRMNRELEAAADELRARLTDVGRAAETTAYLRMRSRVHDVVGQRLSILHRYLEAGQTDPESVAELERLLSSVMADLRGGSDVDPNAELEAIVAAFALVGVRIEVSGEMPSGAVGAAFARIVREACTNSCRHAHACRVFVELGVTQAGRAFLAVSDDGEPARGADTAQPAHGADAAGADVAPIVERGGITGMRREAAGLGGTLTVTAVPRFTVRAEVPMGAPCTEGGSR